MANLLNRVSLLRKEALKVEEIVFENGDKLFVREMTGRERDTFDQLLIEEIKDKEGNITGYKRSLDDYRAKLAVCTVCDEEGNLLLEVSDVTLLSQNMSAARLEKIAKKAQTINKMTEEAKEVIVKNFDAVQDGNSSSDSAES